jgi:adenosylcobinamide kinase/adenosylcobinamide-phosphate guanylyltransferase
VSRTLVLGGARCGKSLLAERLARESGKEVVCLATSRAGDEEMAARITHHRERRPPAWQTVEAATALAATLRRLCAPKRMVLVDRLTLWLSNLVLSSQREYAEGGAIALPPPFARERAELGAWLDQPAASEVVFVSMPLFRPAAREHDRDRIERALQEWTKR